MEYITDCVKATFVCHTSKGNIKEVTFYRPYDITIDMSAANPWSPMDYKVNFRANNVDTSPDLCIGAQPVGAAPLDYVQYDPVTDKTVTKTKDEIIKHIEQALDVKSTLDAAVDKKALSFEEISWL